MKLCKIFTLALAVFMILSATFVVAEAASVYDRQKKNIYLVLDDSSSMGGQNVSDANYSLQALLAMTDKEDSVKIYFLNQDPVSFPKINMQQKDDKMLSDVKEKYPKENGGTPYDKVKVAQQELKDAVSKDDETEYWLVIFTDGGFNDGVDATRIDLENFAQETLANGTKPNILYITAGGGVPLNSNANITNLHAVNDSSIIVAMNEASKVISGRVEATDTEYSDENKTLKFTLPYPAKNIIVFTQNQKTKIANATAASDLNTDEKYTISYPVERNSHGLKDSTVCFITEKNQSSIGKGPVALTFDQPLSPENTMVLYEPAIGFAARYYNSDGAEINPDDLCQGDKIRVEFSICDSETKQPIDDSAFGGKVTYSAGVNGETKNVNKNSANNTYQFEFEITSEDVGIEMHATLPDGYVHNEYQKYTDLPTRRIITFTLSNGGKFSSDFDKLDEAEDIAASVMINGKPATAEQLKEFSISIKGENLLISNFGIEKDGANGCFRIKPKSGWISPLTPQQKTYEVVLKDKDGITYNATMDVEISGKRNWWPLIYLLIVVYIIVVLLTKKYFRWGATFTVWYGELPARDDRAYYQKRTIWGLYWDAFVADITFRSSKFGILRLFARILGFFLIPCGCQNVTMHSIGNSNFSNITLHATENIFKILVTIKGGGALRIKDKTMQELNGKIVSQYGIIRANRRTPADFNAHFIKGLIPYKNGESLYTTVNDTNWYVVYKK